MTTLIAIAKDGEYLEVHPDALKNHRELGWRECDPGTNPTIAADGRAHLDAARAELERRHADLEDLAARQREEADRLDAEAARHAEQAEILANERHRLEVMAKELEAAKTALAAEPAAAGKKKPAA